MANCEAIHVDSIEVPEGRLIRRYRLRAGPYVLEVLDVGCAITRLYAPGRDDAVANVVLAHADPQAYLGPGREYFGAVVGRVANRITDGRFALSGRSYQLARNEGRNHLHGGRIGFDRHFWRVIRLEADTTARIAFERISGDGEEGYPGTLTVNVAYEVAATGEIRLDYAATCDAPTIVNLTNHSYFNLGGAGQGDVLAHRLRLETDRYCEVGPGLLPTGRLLPVEATPFDFRRGELIGRRIGESHPQLMLAGGYDHCFLLPDAGADAPLRPACVLDEPAGGRRLVVETDRPGVQFYSGNFLDGTAVGPGGVRFRRHAGLCLETQGLPDAPNHPAFPSIALEPGRRYATATVWRFEVLP